MNPSSVGWIKKFCSSFTKEQITSSFSSSEQLYIFLKKIGFIYGVSVGINFDLPNNTIRLTKEENTKINLFHSLLHTYFERHPASNYEDAIVSIIKFYQTTEKGKQKFLQKLSFGSSNSETLEKIFSSRLQESNKLLRTDAASLITYALLYIDVIAFDHFLKQPEDLRVYLEAMEKTILSHSVYALDAKQKKNKYDLLVIDLVTNSSQFINPSTPKNDLSQMSNLEKRFLFDICCLAVWDDKKLDDTEVQFLKKLSLELKFHKNVVAESLDHLMNFSETNTKKTVLFDYAHPVKQFYKQSTNTVKLLILRNKKRLIKEINESGELLVLLTQSTQRDLTKEEKGKMKEQLFDIFKSVPSLAIFMLPGGALLLPLFVKLIPKLLPSAFNENRIEDK